MHNKTQDLTIQNHPIGGLFEIYDLSLLKFSLRTNLRYRSHDKYSFILIQCGSGDIFIDSVLFTISSPALYFLRPGQQLQFAPEVSVIGFVISFTGEYLDLYESKTTELVNKFLFRPTLNLNDDKSRFMHHVATKMLVEFSGNAAYKNEILKGFLKLFIIYANRVPTNIQHPSIVPKRIALVQQFHLLIDKHFISKKMVRDYAMMLNISSGYLNEAVRALSGAAASYHIQQRVISEAKRRVHFQTSSMKEIAYSLGFTSQAHFSKYFKNVSGKSFTEFKKGIE